MFPDFLRSDVKSSAEKFLYQAFQKQLSDDFAVFHAVSWLVSKPHNGARDGETDFVVACPKLGILVIEVKGGNINYDGATNQWFSNDNPIKDPFKQACDSKHNLLSMLKKQNYWKKLWIPIGHAVAFPDVKVNGGLLPHAPCEILLDSTQLNNLSDWVQGVMNFWLGQEPAKSDFDFDANSVKELVSFLSPSVRLMPLLGSIIEQEKQELIRITPQQFRVLDFLGSQRRAAISGCAGSGKTLLAVEKARRLSDQGFSVLLTCFNKNLAQFLRKSLSGKKNLKVYHFHGLCKKLASDANLDVSSKQISDQDFLFNELYPELLVDSAKKLNWHVDAVIVDEGQDFRKNWWLPLMCLLNEPDNGIFYVFYDDNQNLYCPGWQPPLEQAPFTLTENWRNTKKIHSHVAQFYRGQNSITALGSEGQPVEIFDYPSNDNTQLQKIIGGILHRLVFDLGIATKDIVILTTTKKQALQNKVLGQFRVKADPDTYSQEVLCNTIHQFKGLESPVVILVETDLQSFSHLRNWLYVGTSRARNHLIVLQPDAPF